MDDLPASTQSMIAGTLGPALDRVQREIEAIAGIIEEELKRQYALSTCDILGLVDRGRLDTEYTTEEKQSILGSPGLRRRQSAARRDQGGPCSPRFHGEFTGLVQAEQVF